jgi:hypothetical protein
MRAIPRCAIQASLLIALCVSLRLGVAAQETDAEATAAAQAVHLSELAVSGALSELYALLHPDAQALVPEPVFIASYNRRIAPLDPGVITVTEVTFEDWTSSVTGVTYPDAALVRYTQPLYDDATLDGAMRLVQDENGTWRWFFGRSQEYIDTEIARYEKSQQAAAEPTSPPPAPTPTAAPKPTRTPRPRPTPAPTPTMTIGTASDNPAPFSQELIGGGARVALLNGFFTYELDYSTPQLGYKYFVLDVRIEGTDEDGHYYSFISFSGEDATTGAGYDSELVFTDTMLDSGTLSRGEYVVGTVVLEVQETAQRIIVKYDPAQFDPNDLYWLFP